MFLDKGLELWEVKGAVCSHLGVALWWFGGGEVDVGRQTWGTSAEIRQVVVDFLGMGCGVERYEINSVPQGLEEFLLLQAGGKYLWFVLHEGGMGCVAACFRPLGLATLR